MTVLIENIGDLVTFSPLAKERRVTGVTPADLGRMGPKAWLAVKAGKIEATGTGAPPAAYQAWQKKDARGGFVMPGLVDSHTHPIYAGSRAGEFWQRANGATYQEIAAAGGGIRSSMTQTRAASDAELLGLLAGRLDKSLRLGITAMEVKSGYGLSVEAELRLLRLLNQAKKTARQHLTVTCLALHAASPEHGASYVERCVEDLLPQVAAEKLADWVDAFIEAGYFSVKDVEPYARKAKDLGLGIRLHADEFTDAGAAAAAAEWGAASADHAQFASDSGIRAMAKGKVTATLLPGTSLYTKIPFAQARRFADAGCAVALATDFNPGSCMIDNLAMLATVAAVQSGFRPAEALAGVTYVAATSLGLGTKKGALAPGFDADFLIYDLKNSEEWLADFGRTPPREVWVQGAICT